MNSMELEKELKDNNLKVIYLFYGKEKYLIDSNIKKIKKIFGNLIEGVNYIKLDSSSVFNLVSELQTPAFGYEKKLIIVRDSDLFKKVPKNKNGQVSDLQEKLLNYFNENLEEISEQNVILFIENEAEQNKLFKFIDENGVTCDFTPEQISDISKRIKYICNAYKVNIDNYVLNYFIESCGMDLQILINEIRKLIEYVGENGIITKNEIDLLSCKQFESVIFDLTDSLGQKNSKNALKVLNNLLFAKEPIQKILVTLYNHFKKLYIVSLCEKYNQDIITNLKLKPNQTFLVNKYKRQVKSFKESEVKNILYQFIELDEKYKAGSIDLNIGLEALICGFCSNN